MRLVALAFVALFAIPAARAEEPSLEAIGEATIVTPRRRHVIGAPEEAKPAPQPEQAPAPAAPPEPEKPVVADKAEKKDAKKGRKDAKAEKKDAAKKGKKEQSLSALVPDAPVTNAAENFAPGADAAGVPAAEPEPEIVSPTHSRNVVLTPAKTATEEVEAKVPKAALPAEEEPAEVREEAVQTPAAPMRNVRIGLGIAVLGTMAGNLAMTHLDHADHFLGDNTQRFSFAHHATEIGSFGAFGATALVEALSPDSRSTVHAVAFVTAALATAAQAGLLVATDTHEGYADQMTLSRAHLGASYAAAAALAVSTVALAF